MADTGLPWELPYPLPTDLVRDGAADIKALAEATADGLDAAGSPGIGSNVVQTVKTDTFVTTSTSFITVTGMTVTITPTSATSKILVLVDAKIGLQATSGATAQLRLTGGNSGDYIGNAAGSRTRVMAGPEVFSASNFTADSMAQVSAVYLDSPATTSAVTYELQIRTLDRTVTVNQSHNDSDNANYTRAASSITVIEVAA